MYWILLLASLGFFAIFGWASASRASKKRMLFPPGPCGIPIFGNILSIGVEPFKTFMKWKMIYGPVFSIQLGSYSAIVLNNEATIKRAFSMSAFSGRPNIPLFVDASRGRGFVTSDGPEIAIQRKFVVKSLKQFVLGDKLIMENKIHSEIQEIIANLRKKSGEVILMNSIFQRPIVNAIWSLLVGNRFESGDPQLHTLSDALNKVVSIDGILKNMSLLVRPISKYIPVLSGYSMLVKAFHSIYEFVDNEFKQEVKDRVLGKPKNYKESYMDKIDATVEPISSFHKQNHYYKETTGELFVATMETINSSIDLFFIHMLRNPIVCHAIQAEIKSVVGSCRHPVFADQRFMPYTQATIQESLRFSQILPLGVYHRVVEDTQFEGYFIPKNTLVIANLYAANHDPVTYEDPEVFCPERFLNKATGEIKKGEILTFSYGKRNCIGESLARDFIFLFVTTILQQFNISLPPAAPLPQLVAIPGLVFKPKHYNIVFTAREVE